MKMKRLNWFNCRNGRDKSRLLRRTMAAMKEIINEFQPLISGKINSLFKNHLDKIEIARLRPYGGAFIYLHALGGLQEDDCNFGGCASRRRWRWLEEWQWPEIVVKYKMTEKTIRDNVLDTPIYNEQLKKLIEAIFGTM